MKKTVTIFLTDSHFIPDNEFGNTEYVDSMLGDEALETAILKKIWQ